MSRANRRQFLLHTSKVLGGLAFVQATPRWAFGQPAAPTDLVERSFKTMGTEIKIAMPFRDFSDQCVERGFRSLQNINDGLTAHHASSVLSHLNTHPGDWIDDRYLFDVAEAAIRFGELTEGALDVTVLPAMKRLGFIPGTLLGTEQIDFTQLEVRNRQTRIRKEGFAADFGGIAKGYGVDQAISALQLSDAEAVLIDAGGDIFAKGRPSADRCWKVGISDPHQKGYLMASLDIENEAIATSGTYVQTRMFNGKEVSHIVDPRSGESVRRVLSATIVAPDTITADALATATTVMQPLAGQALIASLPEVEGFFMYEDGSVFVSDGLKNRLTLY